MAVFQPTRSLQSVQGWIGRVREQAFSHRRRFATAAVVILALSVGYHVVFGQNGLTAYERKRLDAETLRQQTEALMRENAELKSHVDRLQQDPESIEHQAREELHYTRPGEVIYTLPPDPPASQNR